MTVTSSDISDAQYRQWADALSEERLPEGWQVVSSSGFARVAGNTELGIFFKEFLPRSPAEAIKAVLRGSRAKRARLNSETLLRAGFDAPTNLAWGKLGNGHEYLFTAAAKGQGVSSWLRTERVERHGDALSVRRQLLAELGIYIGRLHASGFIHGDLRTSNVLAEYHRDRFRFTLIDNERNSHKLPSPGKLVLKNLMQLNMLTSAELSRSDRWRFFQNWQRQMRELSPPEARLLAIESYLWARRRLAAKGKA